MSRKKMDIITPNDNQYQIYKTKTLIILFNNATKGKHFKISYRIKKTTSNKFILKIKIAKLIISILHYKI